MLSEDLRRQLGYLLWRERAKQNKNVKNHPANAGGISVPSKLRLPIRLKVGLEFAFHRLTPVVCAFDVIKWVAGQARMSILSVDYLEHGKGHFNWKLYEKLMALYGKEVQMTLNDKK